VSVNWDYEQERRRRRVDQSQPLPGAKFNLAIVGACLLGAGIWGLVILIGRVLWLIWGR